METKVCTKCNQEKELNNDNFIWKKTYYEGRCRKCFNEQRRKGNKNIIKPVKLENKAIIKDSKEKDIFNNKEIEILKSIIEDYPEFKKLLNTKIELEKDDNEKIKRSISMSKQVDIKISNLVNSSTLNYSEVVNSLLKKALEFV